MMSFLSLRRKEMIFKFFALRKTIFQDNLLRKNDNVRRVFNYIEQYPIIDINRTASDLGVSYNTVSAAVEN